MTTSDEPDETNQSQGSVSARVIQHVAKNTEQDIVGLPPLYETIDADALERLVASAQRNNTSLSIQFTYAGQEVTIGQDKAIRSE